MPVGTDVSRPGGGEGHTLSHRSVADTLPLPTPWTRYIGPYEFFNGLFCRQKQPFLLARTCRASEYLAMNFQ